MSDQYLLMADHSVVKEDNLLKWAQKNEETNRQVEFTKLHNDVEVSTVFLGLDHRFGDGQPLLFETMVFVDGDEGDMERYSTWDEAVAGHQRYVEAWADEAYISYWQEKIAEAEEKVASWTKRISEVKAKLSVGVSSKQPPIKEN